MLFIDTFCIVDSPCPSPLCSYPARGVQDAQRKPSMEVHMVYGVPQTSGKCVI